MGNITAMLADLRTILMEDSIPFFTEDELLTFARMHDYDLRATAYDCLIKKSMESTVAMSGLTLPDTSKYFLRMAQMYRPFNSGTLKGG